MLKVFKNDVTEWVIALSPEDATDVIKETNGWGDKDVAEYYSDDLEWEECDPDKDFTFQGDSGPVTKPFKDWVAQEGRGYLATTEY